MEQEQEQMQKDEKEEQEEEKEKQEQRVNQELVSRFLRTKMDLKQRRVIIHLFLVMKEIPREK